MLGTRSLLILLESVIMGLSLYIYTFKMVPKYIYVLLFSLKNIYNLFEFFFYLDKIFAYRIMLLNFEMEKR